MRSLLGVLNIFGSLLTWFALYFLLPIITALLYGEFASLRGFVAGGGDRAARRRCCCALATQRYRYDLKPRDAYLLVTVELADDRRGRHRAAADRPAGPVIHPRLFREPCRDCRPPAPPC